MVDSIVLSGADIIVFPEDGVYGFGFSWEGITPYLEYIPDPSEIKWNACAEPDRYPNTELAELIPRKDIYLEVMNVMELMLRISKLLRHIDGVYTVFQSEVQSDQKVWIHTQRNFQTFCWTCCALLALKSRIFCKDKSARRAIAVRHTLADRLPKHKGIPLSEDRGMTSEG
ncbi:uncharacterized protein [Argopecten irradians]|uniref:uncharacterized protein n=1 Tax=Argopecten irradians TaxID=31199 RepID=UPI003714BC26